MQSFLLTPILRINTPLESSTLLINAPSKSLSVIRNQFNHVILPLSLSLQSLFSIFFFFKSSFNFHAGTTHNHSLNPYHRWGFWNFNANWYEFIIVFMKWLCFLVFDIFPIGQFSLWHLTFLQIHRAYCCDLNNAPKCKIMAK